MGEILIGRRGALLVVALCLVLAMGCEGRIDHEPTAPRGDDWPYATGHVFEGEELVELLEEYQQLPPEFLVIGMAWEEVRHVRGLEETADALQQEPELEELRLALEAGGYSEEQIVQMVYLAGTHGSGQEADSLRHRHKELRSTYEAAVEQFMTELRELERERDVRVDRRALYELGIFTTLEPLPVIP